MCPKEVGRPKKADRKATTVRLRMNAEEVKLLDECVEKTEGTRSSVLLQGIKLLKAELDKKAQ